MTCCLKQGSRPQDLPSRCFRKYGDRYPRTVSILCWILLPLLSLDAVAVAMGRWISALESPLEIISNDAMLEATAYRDFFAGLLANVTAQAPLACFEFYRANTTEVKLTKVLNDLIDIIVAEKEQYSSRIAAMLNFQYQYLPESQEDTSAELKEDGIEIIMVNVTDMVMYLQDCGSRFRDAIQKIILRAVEANVLTSPDLSFGWNRCTPYNRPRISPLHHSSNFSASEYEKSLRPVRPSAGNLQRMVFKSFFWYADSNDGLFCFKPAQQSYYQKVWSEDQTRIYDEVLEVYLIQQNLSYPFARLSAFQTSTSLATGSSGCTVNTSSGGKDPSICDREHLPPHLNQ